VDRDPSQGGGGGEPFPTFDPEFTPRRRAPQGGGYTRGYSRRPPAAQPNPWLVGLSIGVVLATISVVAFGLFGSAVTTAETTTTTAATDTTTDTTVAETQTTITLPGGGAVTETIVAIGDPIPINELSMSSEDIGPLDFGTDGQDVLGRLVATFGQPTDDTGYIVGNGSFGECPGDSLRVVRWGPLNVILIGESGSAVFAAYRLDLRYGGISSPTTDIATLSGLRVGDTVEELEATYAQFFVEYVVDEDVGLTFELRLGQNDEVLLWGPVDSQAPDATVTGIYSPKPCAS
jgi:hypothetical protein